MDAFKSTCLSFHYDESADHDLNAYVMSEMTSNKKLVALSTPPSSPSCSNTAGKRGGITRTRSGGFRERGMSHHDEACMELEEKAKMS